MPDRRSHYFYECHAFLISLLLFNNAVPLSNLVSFVSKPRKYLEFEALFLMWPIMSNLGRTSKKSQPTNKRMLSRARWQAMADGPMETSSITRLKRSAGGMPPVHTSQEKCVMFFISERVVHTLAFE